MRRWLHRDEGIAAVELALVLPVLLLLLVAVMPLVKAGWEYMVVSRASAHGVRYATRVDVNARASGSGFLTRRPSADEVAAFVREAAEPLELESVTVSPDPAATLAGDIITVQSSRTLSFGPLAGLVNGVKTLFFGGGSLLPEESLITVTARGREE